MNILLIGGTGVLSNAVSLEAMNQGIQVTMINRGNNPHLVFDGIELIKADKNDYELIQLKLKKRFFDAVIDFLCMTDADTTRSFSFYSKYTKQYFFISSCAVFNTSLGGIFKEDSPKALSIWDYSINKWKSEQNLLLLARDSTTRYTIIRPSITYGDTRIPYGISPKYGYHWTLVARILNGKPIIRWNGGINKCNMMRVEDFAVGVIGLVGNPKAYDEVFNICGDETPSFNDVLQTLSELLGKEVKTIDVTSEFYAKELPLRSGEILGGRSIDAISSNEKIKSVVPSFKQSIFLKEGIAKTIEAYKKNNYQHGIDWTFDAGSDRIIKKWCHLHNIDTKPLHIHFINYLGNATHYDRLQYWIEFYKSNLWIQCLNLGIRFARKIKRKLKNARILFE